ncbi:MAG: methyl-accepting chemotaxis protein [Pseudomonadota bacterium]|nr:methyl-accepting chemotaxis protein [Pseudomonadota bacterium]
MTISTRLLLLVCTALCALLLVAGTNMYQAEHVYAAANYGNENTVPSLVTLDRAVAALGRMRVRMYRFTLLDDPAQRARLGPLVGKARGELDQALRDYQAEVSDARDRQYLDDERALLEQLYPHVDKVMAAVSAVERSQAIALMAQDVDLAQNITRTLEDHIAYNAELGRQGAVRAMAAKQAALWISIGVLVAATIALALQGFYARARIAAQLARANTIAQRIADGDLRRADPASRAEQDEIGALLGALERMRAQLAQTMTEVVTSAQVLRQSAGGLSAAAAHTASASQQQSQASAAVAATVQELTVSIDEVGRNASDANAHALESRSVAESGGRQVRDAAARVGTVATRIEHTAQQIGGLSQDVQEIGKITTVIREVAEQTNLLALNAAIEAARAGEQGRGFAVVADEVRKLAERTTASARGIGEVVERIQGGALAAAGSMSTSRDMVGEVVAAASASGGAMEAIVGSADVLRASIAAIAAALDEQRVASADVARNVEAIAQGSEENANAVATVSDTAQQLLGVAEGLQASVAGFRL